MIGLNVRLVRVVERDHQDGRGTRLFVRVSRRRGAFRLSLKSTRHDEQQDRRRVHGSQPERVYIRTHIGGLASSRGSAARLLAHMLSAKYDRVMNASEMAKALGRRGGRARARRLSVAEKKRIASLGGKARRQSLQAARRIADNFRYGAVLGDLRGQPTTVRRQLSCAGPLPGIYPARS